MIRLSLVATALGAAIANADCTSPAGKAGQFQYFNSNYQVCDGTAWSSMAAAAPSGACTGAGLISYGTGPRFCNGSLYVSMAGTDTGSACSQSGIFQYNSTLKYMQYCNGTAWKGMRNAANTVTYRQQAILEMTTSGTSFTSGSFTGGTGNVAAGNAVICSIVYNSTSASVSSVTATGSQALTRALAPLTLGGGASSYRAEIWYRTNMTASTATKITAVMSSAVSVFDLQCNEYSGIALNGALDQASSRIATGSTVSATTTTTAPKELIFVAAENDASTPTVGSGFTARGAVVNGILVEDKVALTAGAQTVSVGGGSATATTTMWWATFRAQ